MALSTFYLLSCVFVILVQHRSVSSALVSRGSAHTSDEQCHRRVVAYYTSWGSREMTKDMMSYVTHIYYAFPDMSSNGTMWFTNASEARLQKLINLRGKDAYPKLMVAVGGWVNRIYFDGIARNEEAFQTFLTNLKQMLIKYNLDGLDLDWEFPGEHVGDRWIFVLFVRRIRDHLDFWSSELNRPRYILTYAAPALDTSKGFDLKRLFDGDALDWVNVMTYDYFLPLVNNTEGRKAGPPSPLFFSGPAGYYRQNVHYTMEQYACTIKNWNKLVVGIPLYGRFWTPVNPTPVNNSDPIWRQMDTDVLQENDIPWYKFKPNYLDKGYITAFNDKVMAPYAFYEENMTYVGYESPQSAQAKVDYVVAAGLGGVMMWAIDYDDDALSMLKAIRKTDICGSSSSVTSFKVPEYRCYEPRWWSYDTSNFGLCGVSAPLINGVYPVCDSLDAEHACCGSDGHCGSGAEVCECPDCVDYRTNPSEILKNAVAPTVTEAAWFTSEHKHFGRCGLDSPKINGTSAICNPDNSKAHCCSDKGMCGTGPDFCGCEGCVDFKENPAFRYTEKQLEGTRKWWTWEKEPKNVGRCGPSAPLIDGEVATCDPSNADGYCCGKLGYCGSGKRFCECEGCVDYRYV
ncbi:chitinase-like protein 4 [Paramacrobiotus metropolitanus]|uniref:chitinase-like protein 4 n=1 Tax=Paramacrobiotus metropolitanus TaxID=2943436 RepID=UPI0024458886|nr:chitinase-like protein 4 [Paramacrobiotus metropolitanus]